MTGTMTKMSLRADAAPLRQEAVITPRVLAVSPERGDSARRHTRYAKNRLILLAADVRLKLINA